MAGYVYNGTEFDAVSRRGKRPSTAPLDPALCGTTPGASQHRRLKEPCCLKCREWANAQRREKWHQRKAQSVTHPKRE